MLGSCIRDHTFKYCSVTRQPVTDAGERARSIFSDTILEVAKNMKAPINVLHITSMSAFRSDAHVGKWSNNPSVPDCSHWCLPGVPDVWNEILLAYLLNEYDSSSKWPIHIQVSIYLSTPRMNSEEPSTFCCEGSSFCAKLPSPLKFMQNGLTRIC